MLLYTYFGVTYRVGPITKTVSKKNTNKQYHHKVGYNKCKISIKITSINVYVKYHHKVDGITNITLFQRPHLVLSIINITAPLGSVKLA